jgi:hypothetical protein
VPINGKCTVIALTSGLDDSVPFKADYDTHVKYHKHLGFPVLSRAEFELKSKALPNAGLLPPPSPRGGSQPGGTGGASMSILYTVFRLEKPPAARA